MKGIFMRYNLVLILAAALFYIGCEKDSNPADTGGNTTTGTSTFTSNNVKSAPVYFSFDAKDSTISTGTWDIKLTTLYSPDDTAKSFKFPGIVLNRTRNVVGKIVDSLSFDAIDASTATGLKTDPTDTTYVIGTLCLNYDSNTHKLNPYPNRTFVIQTVSGKKAKFRMLTYYNDQGASGYMKLEYLVK
jgi:hypothetical protein